LVGFTEHHNNISDSIEDAYFHPMSEHCPFKRSSALGSLLVIRFVLNTINTKGLVRFEDFTAVNMKNSVFWDVTPCGPCKNRRFGGTKHLHHLGHRYQ
jgi:hypothetical protein